jgi:hypothetical protein
MREIGFPVPKRDRKIIIKKLMELYSGDLEIFEKDNMVWVKGDIHNRFKRKKILYILSGGKHGENI